MTIASEEYMYGDEHWLSYYCATCDSSGIRVKSVAGQPWVVSCLNGHPWILSPAHDIEFEVHAGDGINELTVNRTTQSPTT